jgi:ribosomal protein S18 acetylase RimI-like enzyme
MSEKITNPYIILKEYLDSKDCDQIKKLMELSYSKDQTNLKLELDYKLTVVKHAKDRLKNINEYLYYIDGHLVSYLGICDFGGNVLELNGLTHPDYRRQGLFGKLFALAVQEAKRAGQENVLLLTDEKSVSGNRFIEKAGGSYKTSEYRMKLSEKPDLEGLAASVKKEVTLKTADKSDLKDIARQNAIHFNTTEESEAALLDESSLQEGLYMIQLNGETIGKIQVDYEDNYAFIYGFGILPEFRGRGYGKSAFSNTLSIIKGKNISNVELDVESKNRNALNLYKSFGFEEMSVMNYYNYVIE